MTNTLTENPTNSLAAMPDEIRRHLKYTLAHDQATADPAYLTKIDFNQTKRQNSKDVGAYKHSPEGNPGWTISKTFKATN